MVLLHQTLNYYRHKKKNLPYIAHIITELGVSSVNWYHPLLQGDVLQLIRYSHGSTNIAGKHEKGKKKKKKVGFTVPVSLDCFSTHNLCRICLQRTMDVVQRYSNKVSEKRIISAMYTHRHPLSHTPRTVKGILYRMKRLEKAWDCFSLKLRETRWQSCAISLDKNTNQLNRLLFFYVWLLWLFIVAAVSW